MKPHINMLREFSVPLLAGVLAALLWANLDPEPCYMRQQGKEIQAGSGCIFENIFICAGSFIYVVSGMRA